MLFIIDLNLMDTLRSWMWIVEEKEVKIPALFAMIPLSSVISHPSSRLASGRTRRDSLFIFYFSGGIDSYSFAYGAHFVFLRDVWIRTQRAAEASRRATNLATPSPFYKERYILPSTKNTFFSTVLYSHCFQCRSGSGFI
jgi:hypothetical protein